jgi:hypothetical protein
VATLSRTDNAGKQGTTVDLALDRDSDSGWTPLDTSRTRNSTFSKVGVCRRAGFRVKSNWWKNNPSGTDSVIIHRKPYTILRKQAVFSEPMCGKDPTGWRVCGASHNRSIEKLNLIFIGRKEVVFNWTRSMFAQQVTLLVD